MTTELERRAAGLLMVGFAGGMPGPEVEELVDRGVNNFVLFAHNCESRDGIMELVSKLRHLAGDDCLIAIDHEGGSVNRLRRVTTAWPSQMAFGAVGEPEVVEEAWTVAGGELRELGINLNFAPVADVMADYRNPALGTRVFSDDPNLVAELTAASIRGHHRAGILATAKHFPGHGDTPVDSHVDLPTVRRDLSQLEQSDLVPFQAAIRAGVDCLMVSHVWYQTIDPAPVPATLSKNVIDLARRNLGFDGAIVTDCLEMGAIQRRFTSGRAVVGSVQAGCDMPILSHSVDRQREGIDAMQRAVRTGELSGDRIDEASRRISLLRESGQGASRPMAEAPRIRPSDVAAGAVTLIKDTDGLLPLKLSDSATLALVTFPIASVTDVEGRATGRALADQVRNRHPRTVDLVVADTGDPDQIYRQAAAADVIVVATAFSTGRHRQADVVKGLHDLDKPLVVVALRDPFDLLAFPEVPCYLAVFGDIPVSTEAGVQVIFGEAEPPGRLPVCLGEMYPRGHGLITSRS